jgi:hypothetical protein
MSWRRSPAAARPSRLAALCRDDLRSRARW